MSREEAVEWSLREYNVSRVVTDTPDPSEGVYNENDLIATGTFANGLARATSWKAFTALLIIPVAKQLCMMNQ